MSVLKRYVPLKVLNILKESEYTNKEHLYVICDMIYRISSQKNKEDYSNVFIDIPKYYFRDIITNSTSLKNAFSYLKDNGLIICDNDYSLERGKALGYKFNDKFLSKLECVVINKKTISGKIISNKNERNNSVTEKLKPSKDYFIKNFKINVEEALNYLNDWYEIEINSPSDSIKIINKYNNHYMTIMSISDGDLFFKRNKTNNRVDTNLTSLKSELKQFILNDDELYQIDIVNSQPFMLSLYLKSFGDNEEIRKYSEWTKGGTFYENIELSYYNKTGKILTRKEIKNLMFCIYYSKNNSYKKEKEIFKSIFPYIYSIIEKEKEIKHNQFAIKMQLLESEICIDIISMILDTENIRYFTIHDAWVVRKEDINRVSNIINEEFQNKYKTQPKLKIEKI